MQTYLKGVMCRGRQDLIGALAGGALGGVGAAAVNWVRNSGHISVISHNLPGLANSKVAFLVGGILPAVGGLLGKAAFSHRIKLDQKLDVYEILGMMASIPVAKYLTKSSWKEASVYGGIGIVIALGIKFFPGRKQQQLQRASLEVSSL